MYGNEQTITSREVQGIQIPDGIPVTVPAQTPVRIAQALGDTFTLMTPWGQMVRIESADADAIGKEAATPPEEAAEAASGQELEEQVWDRLRSCYDPEIPVNIVELGLIYDCTLEEEAAEEGALARIKMTLTAPGCGMGQVLADDVTRKLEGLPGIREAQVELVFDPPWNPAMMSEAARLQLGLM